MINKIIFLINAFYSKSREVAPSARSKLQPGFSILGLFRAPIFSWTHQLGASIALRSRGTSCRSSELGIRAALGFTWIGLINS